ncbi:MAG: putative holin-like toxin [Defluviitaleaceae bacterium]|nr:putative holin-like toxin [Defluviitaleaceae bacterium]
MSTFEIIMVIFGASTLLIALIGLMVYIADIISKKK